MTDKQNLPCHQEELRDKFAMAALGKTKDKLKLLKID